MTEPQAMKKELSREVFEAILCIEAIGVSLTVQAYFYRETATETGPYWPKTFCA